MQMMRQLGKLKVYFSGVAFYLSILNFLILVATFKKVYSIEISVVYIVPVALVLALLIGWLDYKLIFRHQVAYSNEMNDIKHQLDRIEERLK